MMPEPDGAVAQVGVGAPSAGVEVDVDDVVEHPHRGADRLAELLDGPSPSPASMWAARLTEPRLQTAISSLGWCSG